MVDTSIYSAPLLFTETETCVSQGGLELNTLPKMTLSFRPCSRYVPSAKILGMHHLHICLLTERGTKPSASYMPGKHSSGPSHLDCKKIIHEVRLLAFLSFVVNFFFLKTKQKYLSCPHSDTITDDDWSSV